MATVMLALVLAVSGCTGADDDVTSATATRSATAGVISTVEGSMFDTIDECADAADIKVVDGKIEPPLNGFDARYPGDAFRLEVAHFGTIGSCNPDAGKHFLRTVWRHRTTGLLLYLDEDERASTAEGIISMTSAIFTSDEKTFYLLTGHDMTIDSTGRGAPSSSPLNPDPKDLARQQKVIQQAVAAIAPDPVRKCLAVERAGSSWADVEKYGIGDPSKAIPEGYRPIELQVTFTDYPACNPPPHDQPAFQVEAKWAGPGDRLMSVDISALMDSQQPMLRDEPGRIQWSNGAWRADVLGDPGVPLRDIAKAIDSSFGANCGRGSRPATFEDLAAWHIYNIEAPAGFKLEAPSQATIFGPSASCPGQDTGARAYWLFSPTSWLPGERKGLIIAGAFVGRQYFQPPENLQAPYSIYWKGADGVQYYVTGFKWGGDSMTGTFAPEIPGARAVMLAVARELDPSFTESKLETPPAFGDLFEP